LTTSEQVYRDNSELNCKIGLKAMEQLNLKAGEHVLDVGCGDGRLTLLLAKKISSGKVIAVDLSEKMLTLAKELAAENRLKNTTFLHSDAVEIIFNHELDFSSKCWRSVIPPWK
jgi:trans-aconitate 2-methyltransferase